MHRKYLRRMHMHVCFLIVLAYVGDNQFLYNMTRLYDATWVLVAFSQRYHASSRSSPANVGVGCFSGKLLRHRWRMCWGLVGATPKLFGQLKHVCTLWIQDTVAGSQLSNPDNFLMIWVLLYCLVVFRAWCFAAVVFNCWGEIHCRDVGQTCCREILEKGVVKKCCGDLFGRVLLRRVGEGCCREVLESRQR